MTKKIFKAFEKKINAIVVESVELVEIQVGIDEIERQRRVEGRCIIINQGNASFVERCIFRN